MSGSGRNSAEQIRVDLSVLFNSGKVQSVVPDNYEALGALIQSSYFSGGKKKKKLVLHKEVGAGVERLPDGRSSDRQGHGCVESTTH